MFSPSFDIPSPRRLKASRDAQHPSRDVFHDGFCCNDDGKIKISPDLKKFMIGPLTLNVRTMFANMFRFRRQLASNKSRKIKKTAFIRIIYDGSLVPFPSWGRRISVGSCVEAIYLPLKSKN